MKTIVSAGIARQLHFTSKDEADLYLFKLDHDGVIYRILDRCDRIDGSTVLVIVSQYNNSPLIGDIL